MQNEKKGTKNQNNIIYSYGNPMTTTGLGLGLLQSSSMQAGKSGNYPPGISSQQQQQQPPYRGYSPNKPKWKGSQPQSLNTSNIGGASASTGFNYQPGSSAANSLMTGVMMASSYPMRQQPLQAANSQPTKQSSKTGFSY